jgi:hypothetical protein
MPQGRLCGIGEATELTVDCATTIRINYDAEVAAVAKANPNQTKPSQTMPTQTKPNPTQNKSSHIAMAIALQ